MARSQLNILKRITANNVLSGKRVLCSLNDFIVIFAYAEPKNSLVREDYTEPIFKILLYIPATLCSIINIMSK
jgi:hypothetical protein